MPNKKKNEYLVENQENPMKGDVAKNRPTNIEKSKEFIPSEKKKEEDEKEKKEE